MIKMGCPGSGSLYRSIVLLARSRWNGPGAPINGYSPTRTRSEDPIYSVLRASGPGGPCDEDSTTRARPDTPFHCIACIIPQGPSGPGVGDLSLVRSS